MASFKTLRRRDARTRQGARKAEDRSLRVMHLHFGKEGGSERFFLSLVEALGEAGVEQRFVTRPARAHAVAHLGPTIATHYRRASPLRPIIQWRVAQITRRWQPDAVMAWMSRAARLLPAVSQTQRLVRLGEYPRHLKNFANVDVIVGNAPGILSWCSDLGWEGGAALASNFVRDVQIAPVPRTALDTPENAFLVAASGRFARVKGFDTLIDAMAMRPDAWLWLIGDGDYREALEAQVAQAGIAARTRFTGWVEEPLDYVAAADCAVMPSRHEPLGNVMLEAWAAGVPVVTTASEGPSWFATDGTDCLMVPIDGTDEMARAIGRIESEAGLAARLVAGAQRRLAAQFSKEAVVARYLQLFRGEG